MAMAVSLGTEHSRLGPALPSSVLLAGMSKTRRDAEKQPFHIHVCAPGGQVSPVSVLFSERTSSRQRWGAMLPNLLPHSRPHALHAHPSRPPHTVQAPPSSAQPAGVPFAHHLRTPLLGPVVDTPTALSLAALSDSCHRDPEQFETLALTREFARKGNVHPEALVPQLPKRKRTSKSRSPAASRPVSWRPC